MTPELATLGATNAARPVSLTVVVPLLTILAFGLAGMSKTIFPAMKFWLVMPAAVTSTLAAFTSALLANTTPDWFWMMIWPLAVMCPAIWEGWAALTRFSTTADELGCWNVTLWFAPTSKLVQSIAARCDCSVIIVLVAVVLICALPAETAPPCGRAFGAWARAGTARTRRADA